MSPLADRLRELLTTAAPEIITAYLFGSEARGTARPESDIDLALLWRDAPPRTLLGQPYALADELQGTLRRPVQVIVLNDAPVDLVHRVLRDGELLVDRDPAARIRFEVAARRGYLDLKPVLDRYRRTA